MLIAAKSIENYIPHRKPFVMIGNLLHADPESFSSDFYIESNNMLAEEGFFQEAGLIENIAQTCAAAFSFLDSEKRENQRTGFIGAISRLEVYELPAVHTSIVTIVKPLHQLENIYLVKGESRQDGRILLSCEMKIVIAK
jgi:predicted hotdog family 3-hydroxylacyl-ACP dehydratase